MRSFCHLRDFMKISILSLCALLVLSIQTVSAKTLVISDIDDTIKMTGVLNSKKAVAFNGLFIKRAFAGMSKLYQHFDRNGDDIFYVSGSPKIISCRVENFLEENHFPQIHNTILRESLSVDTYKYKMEGIRKVLDEQKPDKVILIGDDTQHDPDVYRDIDKEYPGLVEKIYIRVVKQAELPELPQMQSIFTSVEIAGFEYLAGRLSKESLTEVAQKFIDKNNKKGIYLPKRYCPKEGRAEIDLIRSKIPDLKVNLLLGQVQDKIIETCLRSITNH